MNVTGSTHIGLVRQNNQDALEFGPLGPLTQFAVVCDGMGGANGGNVASNIAVRVISERIREGFGEGRSVHSADHLLASANAAANAEIFETASADETLEGMGTTVVTVVTRGHLAYISHVGDSRLYLWRGGELTQITRDHSVVQELIEKGQITEEQARSHPRKHFITRALGVSPEESGEYDELDLEAGDRLLLCTDGLTNTVERDAVAAILAESDGQTVVDALIRAALDGGGSDNVTVVIMDIT